MKFTRYKILQENLKNFLMNNIFNSKDAFLFPSFDVMQTVIIM
jgi:hypothetical protein